MQQDSIGTSASASNIQQSDVITSKASTKLDLEVTAADQQQKSNKAATNDSQKNTQENKSEVSANRLKLLCHVCGKTVYKKKFCRHLKQHPEGTHEKKPCNFCGKLISTKKEL